MKSVFYVEILKVMHASFLLWLRKIALIGSKISSAEMVFNYQEIHAAMSNIKY